MLVLYYYKLSHNLVFTLQKKGKMKGMEGEGSVWYESYSPQDAFIIELGNTLASVAGRIRKCPAYKDSGKCNNLFVLGRTDQKFCSATCRGRVNMWTMRNPQKIEGAKKKPKAKKNK